MVAGVTKPRHYTEATQRLHSGYTEARQERKGQERPRQDKTRQDKKRQINLAANLGTTRSDQTRPDQTRLQRTSHTRGTDLCNATLDARYHANKIKYTMQRNATQLHGAHLEPLPLPMPDTRASPEPGRMDDELPEPLPGLEDPPLIPLARFFDSSSLAMSLCNWRRSFVRSFVRSSCSCHGAGGGRAGGAGRIISLSTRPSESRRASEPKAREKKLKSGNEKKHGGERVKGVKKGWR